MQLKRVALTDRDGTPRNPECRGGRCPAVFETDGNDLIVQGFAVEESAKQGMDIPGDEDVVRVPRSLLQQLYGRWHSGS